MADMVEGFVKDPVIDFFKWRFAHFIINFKIGRYFSQKDISKNQDLKNYVSAFIQSKIPTKAKKKNILRIFKKHIVSHFDNKRTRDINGVFKPITYRQQAWNGKMFLFEKYITLKEMEPTWKYFVKTICGIIDESFFVSLSVNNQNLVVFLNQKEIKDFLIPLKNQNETIFQNKDKLKVIENINAEMHQNFIALYNKVENIDFDKPQKEIAQKIEEFNEKLGKVVQYMTTENCNITILYSEIMGNREFLNQISKKVLAIKSGITNEIIPNLKDIQFQLQKLDDIKKITEKISRTVEENGKLDRKLILQEFISQSQQIASFKEGTFEHFEIVGKKQDHIIEMVKSIKDEYISDEQLSKLEDLDNYEIIMKPNKTKPKFFRMLSPIATLGGVFHVDIDKTVLRISKLEKDAKKILNRNWLLLTGSSGYSKTTTAKILAYDFKKDNWIVCFTSKAQEINKICSLVERRGFNNSQKILIVIDDLHKLQYGSVSEKLIPLLSLINNKDNIKIIATSRLLKEDLIEKCRTNQDLQKILFPEFEEIKFSNYEQEINETKSQLIDVIFKSKKISKDNYEEQKAFILNCFGYDFISLGFALLSILDNKKNIITEKDVYQGIYEYLRTEFQEIEDTFRFPLKLLLQIFIGTAIEAIFDVPINENYFRLKQYEEKAIKNVLDAFVNQGLFISELIEEKPKVDNNSKIIKMYTLKHAKIAEMYISTLKKYHNIFGFPDWKELCILTKFEAYSKSDFNLDEIFSNFQNLQILIINNYSLSFIPPLICDLKFLKLLNLSNNDLTSLPECIEKLLNLEYLDLSLNKFKKKKPKLNLPRLISVKFFVKIITLKIILMGAMYSGKTTFIATFVEGKKFKNYYKMTIGANFAIKTMIINEKPIKYHFWEFAGAPQFRSRVNFNTLIANYTQGVLLFFDLGEYKSFLELTDFLKILADLIPDIPILLVGSKSDLDADISKNEIFEFIQSHSNQIFDYVEISSKTGKNVNKVMKILHSKINKWKKGRNVRN